MMSPGGNLTADNLLYTSVSLAEKRLDRKTTLEQERCTQRDKVSL